MSTVNPGLLVPSQCQQESPVWDVVKKETLFSVKQLNFNTAGLWRQEGYKAALGPGFSLVRQLCSSPLLNDMLCSAPSWPVLHCTVSALCCSLLCCYFFSVSTQWGRLSLSRKRKVHSPSWRGAGLYGQESPPIALDLSILMRMRTPNTQSLIGPTKGTVLIGQKRATLIGKAAQLWLDGRSLNPTGWNRIPGNLYKD